MTRRNHHRYYSPPSTKRREEWIQRYLNRPDPRRHLAISNLQKLSPQKFEELVAFIFEKMGYETKLRGNANANDGGVDIEARRENEFIVIQCKRYAEAVSISQVRDLYGTTVAEGADKGVLVTTGTFSQPSQEWARGRHIELAGPNKIAEWMELCKIGPYAPPLEPEEKPPFQAEAIPAEWVKFAPPSLRPEPTLTPRPAIAAPQVVTPSPRNASGFTWWQWWLIVILSVIACFVCSCAALAGLAAIAPPS
jgi:hypothetical protein